MLTVVHDHRHPALTDGPNDAVDRRPAGLVPKAEGARHRHRYDLGMGYRREVDVVHAVREVWPYARRDLDGQPCLTRPACTGQVHQPVLTQQPPHVGHLRLTSDEAGELDRKVGCVNAFSGSQRRELVAQIRMAQLYNTLGPGQIPQWVGAQIRQPRVLR
jgi:hypothetical protein